MDINFRKIDIDAYDEDVLHESDICDPDPRDPSQVVVDAKQKQAAVRSALARQEASPLSTLAQLTHVTLTPGTTLQNLTLQTLLAILNSTKATDIPSAIKQLTQDDQDTLMKYLYKGMAMPGSVDVNASVLLGWHEKVLLTFFQHHHRLPPPPPLPVD
ncbi:hypothetical protein APHAL10511_003857 [Amanita phalloides]|nr:hypothetical protein APHAL10511_003857 [Amanita phalloides]